MIASGMSGGVAGQAIVAQIGDLYANICLYECIPDVFVLAMELIHSIDWRNCGYSSINPSGSTSKIPLVILVNLPRTQILSRAILSFASAATNFLAIVAIRLFSLLMLGRTCFSDRIVKANG